MSRQERSLENAIIESYRRELRRRYQLECVREYAEFDLISDEAVEELREFFLNDVYPPFKRRAEFEAAFEHLSEILHSPRKLTPLTKVAFGSVWRLGTKLPGAVAAAKKTVDGFVRTQEVEDAMVAAAQRLDLRESDFQTARGLEIMMAELPEHLFIDLIFDMLDLLHALSNVDTLSAMVDIMERSFDVMETRPDLYGEGERAGVALGLGVVSEGLHLFRPMSRREKTALIKGIERVELEWFERLRGDAADT